MAPVEKMAIVGEGRKGGFSGGEGTLACLQGRFASKKKAAIR